MTLTFETQTAHTGLDAYLAENEVVDFRHPEVSALARQLVREEATETARVSFEWVRDQIQHCNDYKRDELTCSASEVLRAGTGFCYAKSHLLVALLRANAIPAGFCFQRLASDRAGKRFVLHGLAAVHLPETGFYRIDPRGNKPGVDAQFTPPVERLAFAMEIPGERLFPGVYPEPSPRIVKALRGHRSVGELRGRLPDAEDEAQLLAPA